MDIQYLFGDGGRRASGLNERYDCTVRAVAYLFDVPYQETHQSLKNAGRRSHCRFQFHNKFDKIEVKGLRLRKIFCKKMVMKDFVNFDLTQIESVNAIVRIRGHVFCIKNGVINDSIEDASLITSRKRVYEYYTISDS